VLTLSYQEPYRIVPDAVLPQLALVGAQCPPFAIFEVSVAESFPEDTIVADTNPAMAKEILNRFFIIKICHSQVFLKSKVGNFYFASG
jgi:hypothetical protein